MKKSLAQQLLVPTLGALVLVFFVMFFLVMNLIEEQGREGMEQQLVAQASQIESAIKSTAADALAAAAQYSEAPFVREALSLALEGDIGDPADPQSKLARENLRTAVAPFAAGIEAQTGNKLRLHVHLPNAHSLLRTWRTTQQLSGTDLSDDISSFRNTVIDVNTPPYAPVQGIEIGRGGFAIRGVAPVQSADGRHLGSVEMLRKFEDVTSTFLADEELLLGVYMDADHLETARSLQDPDQYPVLNDQFVFVTSNDAASIQRLVHLDLLKEGLDGTSQLHTIGSHQLVSFPIRDYRDEPIGVFVIGRDVSAIQAAQSSARTMLLGLLAVLLVGLSFALLYFTRRITRPLAQLRSVSTSIAEGDLDTEIDIDRQDEIGALADTYRSMIDSLKEKAEMADSIADGNLERDVELAGDRDTLGLALSRMRQHLLDLTRTMQDLTHAAMRGRLDHRADESSFSGEYARIIGGMNGTIGSLVGHLDNMPLPISIMDRELNVLYINKAGADLAGEDPTALFGRKCHDVLRAEACRSGNCACKVALAQHSRSEGKTVAHIGNRTLDISYTGMPIHDDQGSVTGVMEIVVDQTEILAAQRKMAQVNEYQTGEIHRLGTVLQAMAEGDLTVDYQVTAGDENTKEVQNQFDKLASDLNHALNRLNEMLESVVVTVEQVTTGSQQVSDVSQSLSEGASHQASSLEEVAAALSEVESQTALNAQNASEANTLSNTAREDADRGDAQMERMLEAMEEINSSSTQVQKIVKVIDEIAFQTNLLALNAAVEAARAGVHGKGFAVVAEEVRNLAQRSAKAAKETTELIEASVKRTSAGSSIATETAASLKDIVSGITNISTLLDEIATASGEQATSLNQISDGVGQIEQVTQSNSASTEESAASAQELSSQAQLLQQLLAQFRLREQGGTVRRLTGRRSDDNRRSLPAPVDHLDEADWNSDSFSDF